MHSGRICNAAKKLGFSKVLASAHLAQNKTARRTTVRSRA